MCGIAGFWGGRKDTDRICNEMLKSLKHRGPDDVGRWSSSEDNFFFVHSRLSIQDLSPAGHQPMHSFCGRYVIVFNGEIYNYLELRKKIDATDFSHAWLGHSDTEVLLAAITTWGLEETLNQCVGMFALALWDRKEKKLFLARDRMGEKPLYYGWQGDTFLFGSELKALRKHPAFCNEIDRDSLTLLFRHNVIPAPYSIYRGISKLKPGMILVLRQGEKQPTITAYWSVKQVAETGYDRPFEGGDDEALFELESIMVQAIKGQMISDVPLGAFLSGGVDSSMVVALMQKLSHNSVKTFSIGFYEDGFNEAKYAKEVARHLGTDHTELYVTSSEVLGVIPKLPFIFDEPFADSSQIPTYLVSSMTKNYVTVALSGDGGDELFGGYNRHFLAKSIWNRIKHFPVPLRKLIANIMMNISPQMWNRIYQIISSILPSRMQFNLPDDKLRKLAEIVSVNNPESMYLNLVSHWKEPEQLVIGGVEPLTMLTEPSQWSELSDIEDKMMFLDTVSYLPDDILTKVDRAAMSVSLETRVPMLDHRLIEFAWRLPLDMKIRNGEGKWLLKQLLYKYVPRSLIERPKMGFGVPIDSWLRGPLKDWAESLLDEKRLRYEGYLNPVPIRRKWEEHLSGKRNWQYHLWDILMFQQWLETQ